MGRPKSDHSQRGALLFEVVIGVSMMAGALFLVMRSITSHSHIIIVQDAKTGFIQFESIIRENVAKNLTAYIKGANLATIADDLESANVLSNDVIGINMFVSSTTDPLGALSAATGTVHKVASDRCGSNSKTLRKADNALYFCILFTPTTTQMTDETFGIDYEKPIFAEIVAFGWNPLDNTEMTFTNYQSELDEYKRSIRVYYTVYWQYRATPTGGSVQQRYTSQLDIL